MKRRIFTTYADSPIKNIKTPIRKINFATGEDEAETATLTTTVQASTTPSMDMLQRIHTLLIVVIVIQLICLFIKK